MYSLDLLTTFALFGLAHAGTKIGFGPDFAVDSTGTTWIREANPTLILPKTPSPQVDRLALWPGMETSNGNLIQAIAVSFADPAAECGAQSGQWCVFASTLQDYQKQGKMVPASAGDKVTMHYVYNDSTGGYDQSAAINGKIVSTISTDSGHATRWDVTVECQEGTCLGRSAAHKYIDTTIVLNEADPSWSEGLYTKWQKNSGLQTADGGKTWTLDRLSLESHQFTESDIDYD
ncbi:uncharacterized protein N7469_011318 [Penicillium citrinum]|uniref:Uncharacterized protein n=1 Tax=Penicillium citrinum TaxID=5077 RepID=A0A9W9ND61_PENCI|nr:uncharacterized protein N7469_011318 [Penicillium citrinum]KAJ5217693.1 hypothetical protein N7469_011318 [Penicillium citrinum]